MVFQAIAASEAEKRIRLKRQQYEDKIRRKNMTEKANSELDQLLTGIKANR